MVALDPVASLAITSTYVTLGGRPYEVQGRPAADWLIVVLTGRLFEVIPGWLLDADDTLFDNMLSGEVSEDDLTAATYEVMTLAGGRPWWYCAQLILAASASNNTWGQLHGALVRAGVAADQIPFSAWIDALYSVCVAQFDGRENSGELRQQFDQRFDTPPPSVPIDEEEEGAAFMRLMSESF